jgi:hypothetical protein
VPGAVKAENQQTQRNYGKGKEVEDSICLLSQSLLSKISFKKK